MKRNFLAGLGLCAVLLSVTIPALAHHAIAAEFDTTKPIKFNGTVKSVDWMNPHIYVNIETKDEAGKTIVYSVEGGPPNALYRQGGEPILKMATKFRSVACAPKSPTIIESAMHRSQCPMAAYSLAAAAIKKTNSNSLQNR